MKIDAVVVVDFGGQHCYLIGRRVREYKVYSEVVPPDVTPEEIKTLNEKFNVKGIILSGGPSSVYRENAPKCHREILELNIPVLGLCYGHQLIAHFSRGEVRQLRKREYGVTIATIDEPIGVLKGLGKREKVWMSHGDAVYTLSKEYDVLAHTENCPVAAFKHREKPIYGLQWHPEVIHTENGGEMLKNFIFEICKCRASWRVGDLVIKATREIKQAVGDKKGIIALSGGVDSSTTAVLAAKVMGEDLTAVFVDHGFMRDGEPEFIADTFKKFDLNFIAVDARERFLRRLKGIKDPERKRKIIGGEFIKVFEEVAREVGAEYLLQGTIYPDKVESGFRKYSDKIKTHHNVAGLPTKIGFRGIVEPLRDLYKDEVRRVAERLKLPKEIVLRQPFPGPGFAVRITNEVTPEKIEIIKKADKIVTEEIEKSGLKGGLWQYFAVLTDTKSTGVRGGSRAYGRTIAVRAVKSKEAMTADFAKIPYDVLEEISTRITNEIPEVTRVVYDITHKPPATIEWE